MTVGYTIEQCWHRVPGGTAVAALATAAALGKLGGVELLGVAARHAAAPDPPYQPTFPVHQLPLPRPALYESWHRLRRPRVQLATGPVDVVHATTIVVPPASAPLVVTVHDLAFLHQPGHFTARGLRLFRHGVELARRSADLVLCSSTATLADCAAARFPAERLRLVPLGVEVVPATVEEVAAARARHGLERPYLVFTGTIEPRKNLGRLLAAFGRLAPSNRLLALVGPAGWGPELATLLGEAGPAADRVRAIGFVPEVDKRALFAGADALCYPSLREGFGLPVLEAMAQGTPVVTGRGTATEEAAGGAAVLVDPLDADDIARGISDALAERDALAARGRARAATMTWARTAELTRAAYRDAAA